MLPVVVVRSSGVSTRLVPATALMDVVLASLPVREFKLSWLISAMLTDAPVLLSVTWPLKLFSSLAKSIVDAPALISAVDA